MTYEQIVEQLHRLEQVETDLLLAAQKEAEAQGDTETVEKFMRFRDARNLVRFNLPHFLGPKGSEE